MLTHLKMFLLPTTLNFGYVESHCWKNVQIFMRDSEFYRLWVISSWYEGDSFFDILHNPFVFHLSRTKCESQLFPAVPTKNLCSMHMCCVVFIIRSRQGNVNINFRAFVTTWKVFLCCYYLSFTWPLHITPHIQSLNCPWIELSFTLSVAIHSVQTDIIIQLELGKSTAWIHAMKKMFDSKKTQSLKKLKLEFQYVTPRYFSSLLHLVTFYPGMMPDAGQTWSN